ncbi:MAG: PAS domain-containing sensor histidine kinase [Lutibacter sp.]|nr:PAS domain-containing sensor histidine kinase [Lutibacter sp.]
MTKINEPNDELIKELLVLQRQYNTLKESYSKERLKHNIVLEFSHLSEERLKETSALLQIVKEKTKIGGWVRNIKKKQAYWSDGVTDILELPIGYKPYFNESVGFYAPEWRNKIIQVLEDCEQSGIPFDEEMVIITAKGKRVWIRVIGEAVENDDEIIDKVNGAFQDISERKFAEDQLKKLSMAVEQSPVSIFITDIAGNIEYVNPKVIEVTGYTLKELIGKTPNIFSAGKTPKSVYQNLWKTIASGKEWHGEFHNKRKNGEFYWELASISPILNEKGVITNYLAVKEDITERKQKLADLIAANEELAYQNLEKEKRAAELIVAKERAEESENLKSAFLANMSHEIRTPMNGIIGFSDLLKTPNLSGEKQQKYLEIIEKSGARMLNIINDIVDISKIESGLMKVYIKETAINDQINNIYNFFKPEAEAKGIQFFIKETSTIKKQAIINTDPEKIYAILSNLVKNAFKYTEKGTIEVGYDNNEECLEFYIKDTGMGIPKDRQKAIFERFIQADISDKMAMQGAGLGLSIAKAYVELLGGKIWVDSEIGKGSTFYFTIPCNWKSK